MDSRVILITGASSGIGAALAKRLAGKVSGLVLHARNSKEKLEQVAAQVQAAGTSVETILCDLSERGSAEKLIDATQQRFGQLDGVAANAGFPLFKSLEEGTLDDIEYAFRGNLFSFFEIARASHTLLKASAAGRIVATGSFTAHVFRNDMRQFPVSAASKGALETAVRSLSAVMSADNITVNCVVPGFIEKDSNATKIDTAERIETASRIPLARFGKTDEVAAAIEFLLSNDASYITGQSLHVNGGLI